jgi:hypothetical protein
MTLTCSLKTIFIYLTWEGAMRFHFNTASFQNRLAQTFGAMARRQENLPDTHTATPGTAARTRSAEEPSPIHRPSSGGGMRGQLGRLANRLAKRGWPACEAKQNPEGARQRTTLQNPRQTADARAVPSVMGGTFSAQEIERITVTREMNSEALLHALQSSLEGIETVIGKLEEIRTRLNKIRQEFEQIHSLPASQAGGAGHQGADSQAATESKLRDCLESIKQEFDFLQEMAFRTQTTREPAQLRSMTTALRALSDLTSRTIVFDKPLPVELVRLSWDAAEILGKSLVIGGQSEETAARFQDLGDPTRYRPDQSDRPINEQVLGVHGPMIVREIEGLDSIHERLANIIVELEGARSNPVLTHPVEGDWGVGRSPVGKQATALQSEPADTQSIETTVEVQSGTSPQPDVSKEPHLPPDENYRLFWEGQGGDPSLKGGGRANSR